jgi:hypothetical protein
VRFVRYIAVLLPAVALTVSCAGVPDSTIPVPENPGYGDSRGAAIEVCKPDGEHAYLARLVCPGGEAATYDRAGTFGPRNDLPSDKPLSEQVASARRDPLPPGEVDYHVVDGYEVTCGASKRLIYLDMYHCHQPPPKDAPPGLSLR